MATSLSEIKGLRFGPIDSLGWEDIDASEEGDCRHSGGSGLANVETEHVVVELRFVRLVNVPAGIAKCEDVVDSFPNLCGHAITSLNNRDVSHPIFWIFIISPWAVVFLHVLLVCLKFGHALSDGLVCVDWEEVHIEAHANPVSIVVVVEGLVEPLVCGDVSEAPVVEFREAIIATSHLQQWARKSHDETLGEVIDAPRVLCEVVRAD